MDDPLTVTSKYQQRERRITTSGTSNSRTLDAKVSITHFDKLNLVKLGNSGFF